MLISGILLILQGLCGMSYGLLISALVNTEREALDITVGSSLVLLDISGNLVVITTKISHDKNFTRQKSHLDKNLTRQKSYLDKNLK